MFAARTRRSLVVMIVPGLLVLNACSKSDLCQSIDDLESSIQGLGDVNVAEEGVDALTQQLDEVKNSFDRAKQELGEAFSADVSQVESAFDDVDGVVQQVQGGAAIQSVATQAAAALSALVTSIQGLVTTAQEQDCG